MLTTQVLILQEADFEAPGETGEVMLKAAAREAWFQAELVMYRGCLVKNTKGETMNSLGNLRPQKLLPGQIVRVRGQRVVVGQVLD